ncbi:MAG: helix-turn-helix domain-containing protein [Proteiniphilum sp.]
MRARHELKFTDKSVKEVGFELGFNTPDYFTYFVKKHTGLSPSQLRKD